MKISLKNEIDLRLRIAREGLNITTTAKKLGISQGFLSQILKGKEYCSAKLAFRIADLFDTTIDELFNITVKD